MTEKIVGTGTITEMELLMSQKMWEIRSKYGSKFVYSYPMRGRCAELIDLSKGEEPVVVFEIIEKNGESSLVVKKF